MAKQFGRLAWRRMFAQSGPYQLDAALRDHVVAMLRPLALRAKADKEECIATQRTAGVTYAQGYLNGIKEATRTLLETLDFEDSPLGKEFWDDFQ